MALPNSTQLFSCASCAVDIAGAPTFRRGLSYCCTGCAADGPCVCSYDQESPDVSRIRHCLDLADPIAVREPARARSAIRTGPG